MAGSLDGGGNFGGHLFSITTANTASNTTAWNDLAASPVTNGQGHGFNPGGFDLSSLAADPHDATGRTIYATVMGFAGNGINAAHLYRSIDAGAHWTNVSSNLPDAPANSVVVDPNDANTLYIAMDTGVYVTTQITTCATANCWSIYGTSLPNAPVVELAAASAMPTGDGRIGELRAATYGRGLWQIPLLTASTAVQPSIGLNPRCAYLRHASGRHGECIADRHGYKYRKCSTDGQLGCDDGRLQRDRYLCRYYDRGESDLHDSGSLSADGDRNSQRLADNLWKCFWRSGDGIALWRRRVLLRPLF